MRLKNLIPSVPDEISQAIEREHTNLESRFAKRDWGPAEMDGGRLAEALLRYLEWKSTGAFTPIGTQLQRKSIENLVENDSRLPDGLRFHVLGCTSLLLDVRNKRDVGHLGDGIEVNEMDSRLVKRLAAWSLSEIIREEARLTPEEAQAAVDRLSARNLSLVEEVGGELVVLSTHLDAIYQAMVVLYQKYPHPCPIDELRATINYKHSTRFLRLLEEKASEALVHIKNQEAYLTSKGVAWMDKNLDLSVKI